MDLSRGGISPSVWFGGLSVFVAALSLGAAEPATPPRDRASGMFAGIEFEYPPGYEELASLLAVRFAAHNAQIATTTLGPAAEAPPTGPLSPAEMRAKQDVYLAAIAAQIGLARPTDLQVEAYGAFLDNYEGTMIMNERLRDAVHALKFVKRATLWPRDELVRRLEAGESLSGFSYDPETDECTVEYGLSLQHVDERLKAFKADRQKHRLDYHMRVTQAGHTRTYHGRAGPRKAASEPSNLTSEDTADDLTDSFPVIIPADKTDTPPATLAPWLWDGAGEDSLTVMLDHIVHGIGPVPLTDPLMSFIVLHETTELGLVDAYLQSADRRWFCDGVANYVPWRVVRDLHGEDVATNMYNLRTQLARYATLRGQVDLLKWPAAEDQDEADANSTLDSARYAFATRAIFLMHERAGDDVLPRLMREIGRTRRDKATMKTVEKAWRKVSRTRLDAILTAAVATVPAAAPTAPAPAAATPVQTQ